MSSDVVGVRDEIEALIGQGQATIPDQTLLDWVSRLRRQTPTTRRQSSTPMNQELAQQIRNLHADGLSHSQIATRLNINHGRVSEVMLGQKFAE
jgi:DNA-binding NarL/FixJ family response regulator